MNAKTDPLDYYLLPTKVIEIGHLAIKEDNGLALDTFRFRSLEFLLGLSARTKFTEKI